MYALKWTVIPTAYQGQGDYIFKTKEDAQIQCDIMNDALRFVRHEVIEEE